MPPTWTLWILCLRNRFQINLIIIRIRYKPTLREPLSHLEAISYLTRALTPKKWCRLKACRAHRKTYRLTVVANCIWIWNMMNWSTRILKPSTIKSREEDSDLGRVTVKTKIKYSLTCLKAGQVVKRLKTYKWTKRRKGFNQLTSTIFASVEEDRCLTLHSTTILNMVKRKKTTWSKAVKT